MAASESLNFLTRFYKDYYNGTSILKVFGRANFNYIFIDASNVKFPFKVKF